MMKLVTVAEMQAIEQAADASGWSYAQMMETAGLGLAEEIQNAYSHIPIKSITGLTGSGNNGGDTLVALAQLARWGWQTTAYLVRPRATDDPLITRLEDAGGKLLTTEADPNLNFLEQQLRGSGVVLDGVFGTGIRLPLKGQAASLLAFVGQILAEMQPKPVVVAVDCPSGVDCDRGEAASECLPADLTVTMGAVKTGLLRFPAYHLVGRLKVVGIGELDGLPAWESIQRRVVDDEMARSALPPRSIEAYKGTFGAAMVVGGSINYTGAVALAGEAAYRIGAGWVTLAIPDPLYPALAGRMVETTWVLLPHNMGVIAANAAALVHRNLTRITALLVGPGFGLEETSRDFLSSLFASPVQHSLGFIQPPIKTHPTTLPPLVLDADGLKLVAQLPDWPTRLPPASILTPHPGEMAALTGLRIDEIQTDRIAIAEKFARQWGHVVTLKGPFTVIAAPDGRTAVNPVATPALARAGTGDVLAGLIVGLRAQGVDPFMAAAAGTWIHAQAGLRAAQALGQTASVLAGDVLRAVPAVLSALV